MFNQGGNSNYINSLFGVGEGLGSIFDLFGGNNPFKGSQQYLNQIPGQLQQYLGPYIGAGQGAMNQFINNGLGQGQGLTGQYNNLMNDPTGFINKIMSGYTQSPQYKNEVAQATTGANRAAAAGGMLGSPAEQSQLGAAIQNYAAQDQQNYLNNALNAFNTGLQGNQGLYNTGAGLAGQQYGIGANAANQMAQGLNQNSMNQLLMNYLQRAQRGTNLSSGLGGLLGGLGGLLGGGGLGSIFGDIGKFFGI